MAFPFSPTLLIARSYNVINPNDMASGYTLDAPGLLLTRTSGGTYRHARGLSPKSAGKYYFEATIVAGGGGQMSIGLATSSLNVSDGTELGQQSGASTVGATLHGGDIFHNSASPSASFSVASGNGDHAGFAADLDNNTFWARSISSGGAANAWSGSGNPATNTGGVSIADSLWMPAGSLLSTGASVRFNFGQQPFVAAPPSGFEPWPS